MKKLISLILCTVMLLGFIPSAAFGVSDKSADTFSWGVPTFFRQKLLEKRANAAMLLR